MKRLFSRFAVLCLLSPVLCLAAVPAAGPVVLDPGLAYLRISSLTQSAHDLSDALLRPIPLVVDLRYTADEPDAAAALRVLNSEPAKPRLFVLVSPSTPDAIAAVLGSTSARLVTLGIKGSHPAPQVVVAQSAADDRRAYTAFDGGTPLANLVSGKVEKDRFDEATLVQEFKNGNHDAHPPETPAAGVTPPPARLVDRVLQRAVHLHRALAAMKQG